MNDVSYGEFAGLGSGLSRRVHDPAEVLSECRYRPALVAA
jgi:hypothetical protein